MVPSDPDQLFTEWSNTNDPVKLRGVVDSLDSTISSAIKSYAPGTESPVVRQRARLMAADAVRTYKPGGDAKLSSYVYGQLQTLRRTAARMSDPLPKPERLAIETSQMSKHELELSDKLGRQPSVEELAEYGNYDIKKLRRLLVRNRAVVPESSLQAANEDSGEDDEILPGVQSKSPEAVWADYVYHDLNDVDKVVFQHRTGYRGAPILPNQEIARRLRLSAAAVTQRATRLQTKMDSLYAPRPA